MLRDLSIQGERGIMKKSWIDFVGLIDNHDLGYRHFGLLRALTPRHTA
jgi:hypothetical protein